MRALFLALLVAVPGFSPAHADPLFDPYDLAAAGMLIHYGEWCGIPTPHEKAQLIIDTEVRLTGEEATLRRFPVIAEWVLSNRPVDASDCLQISQQARGAMERGARAVRR